MNNARELKAVIGSDADEVDLLLNCSRLIPAEEKIFLIHPENVEFPTSLLNKS